jgi:hypothetical protein
MDEHEQFVLFAREHVGCLKIVTPASAGTNQKLLSMFSRCSRLKSSERKRLPNQASERTYRDGFGTLTGRIDSRVARRSTGAAECQSRIDLGVRPAMKAAALTEAGRPLEVICRDDPLPGPGEPQRRVLACGVCRSDLHVADRESADIRTPIIRAAPRVP